MANISNEKRQEESTLNDSLEQLLERKQRHLQFQPPTPQILYSESCVHVSLKRIVYFCFTIIFLFCHVLVNFISSCSNDPSCSMLAPNLYNSWLFRSDKQLFFVIPLFYVSTIIYVIVEVLSLTIRACSNPKYHNWTAWRTRLQVLVASIAVITLWLHNVLIFMCSVEYNRETKNVNRILALCAAQILNVFVAAFFLRFLRSHVLAIEIDDKGELYIHAGWRFFRSKIKLGAVTEHYFAEEANPLRDCILKSFLTPLFSIIMSIFNSNRKIFYQAIGSGVVCHSLEVENGIHSIYFENNRLGIVIEDVVYFNSFKRTK